jgi:deoxyribonuclease-4
MQFGIHLSIADGIEKVPEKAHSLGCECFQIFSKSPHGGARKKIDQNLAEVFKKNQKTFGISSLYIHTPYYINFASANNRIFYGSISSVREELEIADLLGAKGVVTHLGSAKELGDQKAREKIVQGICKIFESPISSKEEKINYKKFDAKLLLEITAGSGNIMGDSFEEIAYFIEEAEKQIGKDVLRVCFDTAHAFASGYDLKDMEAVKKTFDAFDKIIGIDRIELIHLNDSLADFNSHVDRHANIGQGRIGLEGISAILQDERLADKDFVLETPQPGAFEDIKTLKGIRDSWNKAGGSY